MNIHKNPNLLLKQLEKLQGVNAVSYEYPGFWLVDTPLGAIYLGDTNGFISWHNEEGDRLHGETMATTPATIARDFGAWLKGEF